MNYLFQGHEERFATFDGEAFGADERLVQETLELLPLDDRAQEAPAGGGVINAPSKSAPSITSTSKCTYSRRRPLRSSQVVSAEEVKASRPKCTTPASRTKRVSSGSRSRAPTSAICSTVSGCGWWSGGLWTGRSCFSQGGR